MIRSNGAEYYAKVVELIGKDDTIYTFFFGGKTHYCFTASITSNRNYIPHIDTIEYDTNSEVTADLVKAALWTMKKLFPHVEYLTLLDDSHIPCERGNKLSLAYDYIIKYNKTWYEYHFNATLPGDNENRDSILGQFKDSLKILDEKCILYEYIITKVPEITKYKDIYMESDTPRMFINKLRDIYGKQYCNELSDWLSRYMSYLGIDLMKKHWRIYAKDIKCPEEYELFTSTVELNGGKLRKRNGTRKRLAAPIIGYYGDPGFE
jgi:hypothetical protein